jgi:hypothetical protein
MAEIEGGTEGAGKVGDGERVVSFVSLVSSAIGL